MEAGLERDVNLRYSAHLIQHRYYRGFRDLIDGETGG